MLGLGKKDFYIMKNSLKTLAIMLVFYVFLAWQESFDISFVPPFMSIIIMFSTFSYDDINNFNCYAATFPEGKRNLVLGKYLVTIIFTVAITFFIMLMEIIIASSRGLLINYEELLVEMVSIITATSFVEALMYPIVYKLGIEKARIFIFVFTFGIFLFLGLLAKFIDFSFLGKVFNFLEYTWYLVLPIFTILILGISYLLSKHFHLKKDF